MSNDTNLPPDQPGPESVPPSEQPAGNGNPMGRLLEMPIEEELKGSYLTYAMSVIVSRALPDVRDGLKPSQRRILVAMNDLNLGPGAGRVKCAKISGDTSGNYHPHGEGVIYPTLVRMAQEWNMRHVLVDKQGNFGSIAGLPPAAMRYTEARLSRIATALLEDIDKETVDFRPNYDDSEQEPEVLPTRVPNLLVNGSAGIAVGMATNIPPHNLTEIIDAAIYLIQHPNAPLAKILELVPGPDFPTAGFILGRQGIIEAYTTGRGQIRIRAKAAIERTGKDHEQIVVTEIPYQVNKAKLIEHVASLINDKKLEGMNEPRDESDRDGLRIVFPLKRGEQAEVILNNLYKHTQLQVGFGIIMLSIVNGQPREMGLVDIIKCFIEHRIEVVRRRTEFELRKARDREHILLGFRKALRNLDDVIKLIRAAGAPREARESLVARFEFTEKQAQAIIELQLQRLTGMEQQKILDELAEIERRIAEYLGILGSDKILRDLIIDELREVRKDYGDERRTQIVEDTGEIQLEDLVAVEDVAITVTRGGYLKRTSVDTYRRQTRGGKGRIGMGTRAEDFVERLIVASTHSYLLIFTTRGRVYWLKAYEIPDATTVGKGKHISNLISLQPDETAKAFLSVKDFVPDQFIMMVTRHAVIKKSELTEFDNPMSRGIIAVTLDEGDELISAKITPGDNYVFLGSHQGQAIRFLETQVRPMGRQAHGVRAMHLAEGDYLIGMEVVEKDGLILSIAENGYGKRTPLENYRLTARGGKGVINMKTTHKTGKVVGILSVKEDSDLMIVSQNGKIIRIESSTIRQAGRSTQGVRLVTLEEGDKVAAASVIPETENGNGNGDGQETAPVQ